MTVHNRGFYSPLCPQSAWLVGGEAGKGGCSQKRGMPGRGPVVVRTMTVVLPLAWLRRLSEAASPRMAGRRVP